MQVANMLGQNRVQSKYLSEEVLSLNGLISQSSQNALTRGLAEFWLNLLS